MLYVSKRITLLSEPEILIRSNKPKHSGGVGRFSTGSRIINFQKSGLVVIAEEIGYKVRMEIEGRLFF